VLEGLAVHRHIGRLLDKANLRMVEPLPQELLRSRGRSSAASIRATPEHDRCVVKTIATTYSAARCSGHHRVVQ
jgi:hypothetical protein